MNFLWIDHSREIFLWDVFYIILGILIIISFFLRGIPVFGWLWSIFKWIFIAWFVILGVDMAKKSLKNWWDK
jgi:hypothetical protein